MAQDDVLVGETDPMAQDDVLVGETDPMAQDDVLVGVRPTLWHRMMCFWGLYHVIVSATPIAGHRVGRERGLGVAEEGETRHLLLMGQRRIPQTVVRTSPNGSSAYSSSNGQSGAQELI
eukprot:GHVO01000463.1.p1 GENE.GHVO01000463.1~~GHVO01000463.1.p1  ORF type:complete len:119 (-),score=8.30 GHVO01000463.1:30-386(-)